MNITGRSVYQKFLKRRRKSSHAELLNEEFLAWLRKQPCCICGQYKEWLHGSGRSQAAHVRLGGRGALADKPLFSAVPLCNEDHGLQHQHSHEAFGNKEVWLNLADSFLRYWMAATGRKTLPSDRR